MRLFKTRSAAAACRSGHVRVNGTSAKAAQQVRIGDEVRLRAAGLERIVVVARPVAKRVSAVIAAECLVDHARRHYHARCSPRCPTAIAGPAGLPCDRLARDRRPCLVAAHEAARPFTAFIQFVPLVWRQIRCARPIATRRPQCPEVLIRR